MIGFGFEVRRRPRSLALGAGSGDRKDKLMIGGLAVIIALAIFALIMSVAGTKEKSVGPDSMWYMCVDPKCGQAFEVPVKDLREAIAKLRGPTEDRMPTFQGPQCKQQSGVQARKCPSCDKPYIPSETLRAAGRPVPAGVDKCPSCGIDIRQWYVDHAKKK